MTIWLVGAGPMAGLHADVLAPMVKASGERLVIVANSAERAAPLAARCGADVLTGGVSGALAAGPAPERAVIALPVNVLAKATAELIAGGVKSILVEKPGGMSADELAPVVELAAKAGAEVFVAYNRRFFAASLEAEARIRAAGGVSSFTFEFTEDADRIAALPTPAEIKERWAIANSSHVIDLAFHLCGVPAELVTQVSGHCSWHPAGADFRGFGTTAAGAPFSYGADWRGPGRWALEIVLPNERLILKPMERLQRVPRGKFEPEPVEIDDSLDKQFKPGLWRQMQAFLTGEGRERLPTLAAHRVHLETIIEPIAGYRKSGA